jgi:hypothetical protein
MSVFYLMWIVIVLPHGKKEKIKKTTEKVNVINFKSWNVFEKSTENRWNNFFTKMIIIKCYWIVKK